MTVILMLLLGVWSAPFQKESAAEVHTWNIQEAPGLSFASTLDAGLMRSVDGGRTWESSSRGLPASSGAAPVAAVVAIAASPKAPFTLYCATELDGIFRSVDSGTSWTSASGGLPVPLERITAPPLLAVDASDPDLVYTLLTVPIHSHLEEVHLYRSDNGGLRWFPIKQLPGDRTYDSIVVESPRRIRIHHTGGAILIQDTASDPGDGARMPQALPLPGLSNLSNPRADQDVDEVAVMEDDGSLLLRQFALSQKGFEFKPNAADGYDLSSVAPVINGNYLQEFVAEGRLSLADDSFASVTLPFSFRFYGRSYGTLFVNSNGSISFGSGDTDSSETSIEFFTRVPKIAGLWDDLDPAAAGGVFTKGDSSRFVVTWNEVPEFAAATKNTFQIILFPDDRFQLQYGAVAAIDGLVGASNGNVTSGYFVTFNDLLDLTGLAPAPIHELFSPTPLNGLAITQRFYETHDDDFDAVLVFGAGELPVTLAGLGATAFHATVRNDVRGIGRGTADLTSVYGSGGRLQSYLNMNSLAYYPANPAQRIGTNNDNTLTLLGQEWGHRFLSYARFRDGNSASLALLGRDNSHWNYFLNSNASVVEGNEWRDNGDGSFTATDDTQRYGLLDQYLMGLRTAAEVPNVLLITDPQPVHSGTIQRIESTFGRTSNAIRDSTGNFSADRMVDFRIALEGATSPLTTANTIAITTSGRTQAGPDASVVNTGVNLTSLGAVSGKTYSITKLPGSTPRSRYFDSSTGLFTSENVVFRGVGRSISINDIIAQEGQRIPDAGRAQSAFRHAFILVVPRGSTATSADLSKLATIRRAWESFYSQATGGRGSVSTSLATGASSESQSAIAPNGGWVYTRSSRASLVNDGYGTLDPGGPGVTGVAIFTSRTGNQVVSEAAVAATAPVLGARFFVERTASVNTGFAAVAPTASTLTLDLIDASGVRVASSTQVIPAGGHISRFANELFSSFTFPNSFVGSIVLSATAPVAVVVLRTIVNQVGDFLITTLPIADTAVPPGSAPLYLPQVVDAGGYQTDLLFVNPTVSAISGTAEFVNPDGIALSLTVNGVTGSSIPYQLPANGAAVLRTSGSGASARRGYVIVRPVAGAPAPIVGAVVTFVQEGLLVAATGVASAPASRRVRLYFDRTIGHDTGVAIVNLTDNPANLQLTLRNLSGASGGPGTQRLSPQGQSARYVSEISPSLPSGSRGVLEVTSDSPIAVIAVRSTQSGNRSLLSTLPVDDLDRLPAAVVRYFPQIAAGGGYTTELILLNEGASVAPVRLTLTPAPN